MKNFSSWLIAMFAFMFWGFRLVGTALYSIGIDFMFVPSNMTMEVVLLFLTFICICFMIKRRLLAAVIYLIAHFMYYGPSFVTHFTQIMDGTIDATQVMGMMFEFFGLVLAIAALFDVLLDKNRKAHPTDKKTDWFYKNKEFDEVYDILVYAVFVALGFAAFENILYVFGMQSIQIGILRGLLAIPGHVCDGITMGYYLSIARYNEKLNNQELVRQNKIKSILMPTLYHGIYDFCCLTSSVPLLIVFILFIIFLYTISIKRIKILATERTMIINRNNFCPRCGNKMTNNYCSNCGFIQK